MPDMQIRDRIRELRRVRAGDLKPSPRNWRTHPQAQQDALRGVLAEIGYADALIARELADGSLELVDGHLRAETTPDTEVPVLVTDLDEAEAAKVLATLDPLAAMATADPKALDALLRDVQTSSEAVAAMLTGLAETNGILAGGSGEVVEDEVPEPPADPVTKPGDLWLLGEHRVLCGDSTKAEDVARVMGGEKADMVLTDPPYGVSYHGGSGSMYYGNGKRGKPRPVMDGDGTAGDALDALAAMLKASHAPCVFIWHAPQLHAAVKTVIDSAGLTMFSLICWNKNVANFAQMGARYKPKYELAAACKIDRIPWYGPDNETTVWDIAKPHASRDHPTQKPVELFARAIRNHTKADAVIADPFLGSGTTLIAAEQLNRKCYGLEISPQYCDVIVQRWENLTGKKAKREKRKK